jgi:NifU-like protein involved in Fe-S cluster formation
MYRIHNWLPCKDGVFSRASFSIVLTEKWKKAVDDYTLSQEELNRIRDVCEKIVLEGHGYEYMENFHQIEIVGDEEWGISNIKVPGNACGVGYAPCEMEWNALKNERELKSHNMDSVNQASMTLAVFLQIAEFLDLKTDGNL